MKNNQSKIANVSDDERAYVVGQMADAFLSHYPHAFDDVDGMYDVRDLLVDYLKSY